MLGHLALARRVLYYIIRNNARMWLSQFVEQYVANGAEMSEWRHAERLEASWTGGSLWSLQKGTYCPDGLQLFICTRAVDVTWHRGRGPVEKPTRGTRARRRLRLLKVLGRVAELWQLKRFNV